MSEASPSGDTPPSRHDEVASAGDDARGGGSAPFVAGVLIALPQVLFPYPAMTDLPFHEGLVAVLRHMHDPSLYPAGLYVTNFGHANQLFYFLSWGLSYALGVPLACRIVVAATLFAIPVAGARFADHIGATRWTTLLLAPVAVGWLYFNGLIANMMGLAALLTLLPTLDRLAEAPSKRRALAASAACFLLYEAHLLMLVAYAGAALVFAASHELRARPTALRLSPFATAVALIGFEGVWGPLHQPVTTGGTPTLWSPFWRKLFTMPGALFGAIDPRFLYPIAGASALCVALLLAARVRDGRAHGARRPREPRRWRPLLHHFRFEAFALLCFILYLALPRNLHDATLVFHRFLAPAYAVVVVCASARGRSAKVSPLMPIAAGAALAAALFNLFPLLMGERADVANVGKLFSQMHKNSAFVVIEIGPRANAMRSNAAASVGERALTFVGGRTLFGFAESAVSPVQYARPYEWEDPIRRTMFDALALRPAHDLTLFRYLLVRSTSTILLTGVAVVLSDDARLVDTAGDWALFESKLPTVALLAPDATVPAPPPETLRAMLDRFAHSRVAKRLERDGAIGPSDLQADPDPSRP